MSVAMDVQLDIPRFSEPARCAETDPDAFYPEKVGQVRAAFAVCAGCPARQECLQYALDRGLTNHWDGVWGGTSPAQRRAMLPSVAARKEQRNREIRALHTDRLTPAAISKRISMPVTTVYSILGKEEQASGERHLALAAAPEPPAAAEDVVARPAPVKSARGWTDGELTAAARQLQLIGMPTGEIAAALEVAPARIRAALRGQRSA